MSTTPSDFANATASAPIPGSPETAPQPSLSAVAGPRRAARCSPVPGADIPDEVLEYFHALLRRLPWPDTGGASPIRNLAVTSCHRGEGVSQVALHSALAAASTRDCRVLLVDANVARPTLHRNLGLSERPGLLDLLVPGTDVRASIQTTRWPNLYGVAAGRGSAARLYELPDRLTQLLSAWKQAFDLVICDMPAVGEVPSALPMCGLADGVVLVIEHERIRWQVARRTLQSLQGIGVNVLGVALNKWNRHIPDWLYRTL
jgi:Mrp family chromosome partitioning ATPase